MSAKPGGPHLPATDVSSAVRRISSARERVPASRSVLVAISGIDGSGKGWVAARLREALVAAGLRAEAIGIDGWLELPQKRFDARDPAGHFYSHAIRFPEMFSRLVFPLRERRSLRIEADYAEETATCFRKHVYEYEDLDVILLEGIFLLKRAFQRNYDLSLWIDCSFDTALERAIARAQEGLPPAETVRAYRTLYFPAQELHFERDDPRGAASAILTNDPRLAAGRSAAGAPRRQERRSR